MGPRSRGEVLPSVETCVVAQTDPKAESNASIVITNGPHMKIIEQNESQLGFTPSQRNMEGDLIYRRLTAITSYLQKQRAEIIEKNVFILKISGRSSKYFATNN